MNKKEILNNLEFSKTKINDHLKELEQIKNFNSNSYNRRKLQLKVMIKRHKKNINIYKLSKGI